MCVGPILSLVDIDGRNYTLEPRNAAGILPRLHQDPYSPPCGAGAALRSIAHRGAAASRVPPESRHRVSHPAQPDGSRISAPDGSSRRGQDAEVLLSHEIWTQRSRSKPAADRRACPRGCGKARGSVGGWRASQIAEWATTEAESTRDEESYTVAWNRLRISRASRRVRSYARRAAGTPPSRCSQQPHDWGSPPSAVP